jgi:hypothetical protein
MGSRPRKFKGEGGFYGTNSLGKTASRQCFYDAAYNSWRGNHVNSSSSFPRRRESRTQQRAISAWIPAFAGMTD